MKNRYRSAIRRKKEAANFADRGPVRSKGKDSPLSRNYHVDLSENSREGDEYTGDEHSSGLQGEDSEFLDQPHIESGMPGDEEQDLESHIDEFQRKRAPY